MTNITIATDDGSFLVLVVDDNNVLQEVRPMTEEEQKLLICDEDHGIDPTNN